MGQSSSRTWNFTDMFPDNYVTEAVAIDQTFGMDASLARPGPCGDCNNRPPPKKSPPKQASYNFFVNDGSPSTSNWSSMDSGIVLDSGGATSTPIITELSDTSNITDSDT